MAYFDFLTDGGEADLQILHPEHLDAFKREGYVVVKDIFSKDDIDSYKKHLEAWLQERGANIMGRNHQMVGDRHGGFMEMYYGRGKELLWSHEGFDKVWTDIFSIYQGETQGFEHSQGTFDPQEKYLFPDKANLRFPDSYGIGQEGITEHVDWDVYNNVYGPDEHEFGNWLFNRKKGAMVCKSPIDVWRPVQCSVAITKADAGEGNFRCAPGWHLKMAEYSRQMRNRFGEEHFRKGWVQGSQCFQLNKAEGWADEMLRDFIDVPVEAGDIILWDTRLPHCNHAVHNGKVPRICDFNSRIPGTPANKAFAQRMFSECYEKQLHYGHWISNLEQNEKGPLKVHRLTKLARRLLAVPDVPMDAPDEEMEENTINVGVKRKIALRVPRFKLPGQCEALYFDTRRNGCPA